MRFRPCIDIHNGKVKQIVGGSLQDEGNQATENFVSNLSAKDYAGLYKRDGLVGGHMILLNKEGTDYYEDDVKAAMEALKIYPGGLQIGGGIHAENAERFLKAGASHVIVTSYVFQNGRISYENLEKMVCSVGKENLVLDLSCRKKDGSYYIVTDRWQKFTEVEVNLQTLEELASYCGEFLIHGVDLEGMAKGIEENLVTLLGEFAKIPITYAGGVGSYEDIELLNCLGKGKIDVTIGSALDLFGGNIAYERVKWL